MEKKRTKQAYLPMTETMFYILLSLTEQKHGYGIMQHVEELTSGRIRLGAGTTYSSLSKLEKDDLIHAAGEQERRKLYVITDHGRELLRLELDRLRELVHNGCKLL